MRTRDSRPHAQRRSFVRSRCIICCPLLPPPWPSAAAAKSETETATPPCMPCRQVRLTRARTRQRRAHARPPLPPLPAVRGSHCGNNNTTETRRCMRQRIAHCAAGCGCCAAAACHHAHAHAHAHATRRHTRLSRARRASARKHTATQAHLMPLDSVLKVPRGTACSTTSMHIFLLSSATLL